MKEKQEEAVSQIHHSALEVARLAHLCMTNQRVGLEWLRNIKHANERIAAMIERLEKE